MKKKFLFMALGVSMLGIMTGNFVKADDEVQEEESIVQPYEHQHRDVGETMYREAARVFAGGDGTENSPYEISSAEELQYLSELLSDPENRSTEYRTQNYILTADISLNDASDYENWGTERPEYDWRSIGAEATFTGVFDGNGHTISGLYQNRDLQEDNADASSDYSGLFADVYCATIKNLNLTDVYIEVSGDASKAGGIAGNAAKTQILNCTVNGTVIGYDGYYGGITGSASGTISGCEFDGTVKAVKDLKNGQSGLAYLGGITGDFSSAVSAVESDRDEKAEDFAGIVNCLNKGNIEAEKESASAHALGGIAGSNSARITGCVNEGTVEAKVNEEDSEGTSLSAGGITGDFSVVVMGEDGILSDCINNGTVISDNANTGGITGSVYLSDPRYTVTIENCKNVGKVFSTNHYYAGIAADACIKTDSTLTVSGCMNEVDFTEGEGAGIVHHLAMQKGNVVLSDCVNHGKIVSFGQNAAGILCYTTNMGNDWNLELENCENTGDISSEVEAGGIACFTAYYKTEENANTSFTIRNCKNSGNLSSPTTNGYMGGILAVDGFMLTKTEIDGCENSGNISFTKQWVMGEADLKTENDEGEKEDASLFTLSVMGGGIVGRIGESVLLSVDADKLSKSEINKKDALVMISNCTNTGSLSYEEPQKGDGVTEEEFQKAKAEYWKPSMGGILGDCSCTNGFSVNFENCTYSTERGVGNVELPDSTLEKMAAVEIGYRHIDTAQAYGNERGVGEGVRTCGIPREELFVVSKVAAEHKTYEDAARSIDETLEKMGLDYLDMMIIHSPQPWVEVNQSENRYVEGNRAAWKALEDAYKAGKLKAIGVSNFQIGDIESLVETAEIKPMVNQILLHISNTPLELVGYCQKNGIAVEAYSPNGHGEILNQPEIKEMAEKYGVSVPQLCIRYTLQLGTISLPKTANPDHMKANAEVDFKISPEDMEILKNFKKIESYGASSGFPVYGGKL